MDTEVQLEIIFTCSSSLLDSFSFLDLACLLSQIVLPAHLIGGHPSNELLVTKFELIRLLILDMMEVTSDPVYHRRIHQKGATGKISVVRGATGGKFLHTLTM
jgi:hypothetical protein